MPAVDQQAVVAQQPEPLAQGVARDLERAAEPLLGELRARRQLALEDRLAEHRDDVVGGADPRRSRDVTAYGEASHHLVQPVAVDPFGSHATIMSYARPPG